MSSVMHVRRLRVPQPWKDRLLAVNITDVGQIVTASELELMEILDLPPASVIELLRVSSDAICPPTETAAALFSRPNSLSLSLLCPPLLLDPRDPLAHACLPAALSVESTGGITELVGPTGSGKTQALLSLAARYALPQSRGGAGAAVVLVQLGQAQGFSSLRLLQVLREQAIACRPVGDEDGNDALAAAAEAAEEAASRVLVLTAGTVAELRSLMLSSSSSSSSASSTASLEDVVSDSCARLVLVDGLSSLLVAAGLAYSSSAGSFTATNAALHRQQLLGALGAALKALAAGYGVGVVVTNAGSSAAASAAASSGAAGAGGASSRGGGLYGKGRGVKGQGQQQQQQQQGQLALGPGAADAVYGVGWTHAVTTRIVLSAVPSSTVSTDTRQGQGQIWLATVAKSPAHPRIACPYVIGPRGLHAFAADAAPSEGAGAEFESLWGTGLSQYI